MHNFHDLHTIDLSHVRVIQRPTITDFVGMDTSALQVFTDFNVKTPLTLERHTSLQEARWFMQKIHVRSALVTDRSEIFLGLITASDLAGRRVLSAVGQLGVSATELSIGDIMTPKAALHGLSYSELARSRVGDLLGTLQHDGSAHLLVVDDHSGELRGLVSATDVAKMLHVPLDVSQKASGFNQIYQVIGQGLEV